MTLKISPVELANIKYIIEQVVTSRNKSEQVWKSLSSISNNELSWAEHPARFAFIISNSIVPNPIQMTIAWLITDNSMK